MGRTREQPLLECPREPCPRKEHQRSPRMSAPHHYSLTCTHKPLVDNEASRTMSPIFPHAISVSPTGHVLLTLDTQAHGGPGGLGRDLVAWGKNHDYQLGTGKRSSLPVPTTLERPEGGRFILGQRKALVRDLAGNVWKKRVEVEQCAVAGYGNSIIYWKIK